MSLYCQWTNATYGEQRKPRPHTRMTGEVGLGKGNYKGREGIIFMLHKICCHGFKCRSDTNVDKEGLTQDFTHLSFAIFNAEQIHVSGMI